MYSMYNLMITNFRINLSRDKPGSSSSRKTKKKWYKIIKYNNQTNKIEKTNLMC